MSWSPWLPPEAITSAYDRIDLSALVADWSSIWLGHGPVGVAGAWQDTGIPDEGVTLLRDDGLAGLWLAPDLRMILRSRMFGAPPYGNVLTQADTDRLEQAADSCIEDLCTRLCEALELDLGIPWRQGRFAGTCQICPVGKGLSLIVATQVAIDRYKATMPAPKRQAPLAAKLDEALSSGEVRVGARIGGCQLTLAELKSLMPGDVLTLDRAITRNVQITIDGECTALPCLLVAEQYGLTLVLQ